MQSRGVGICSLSSMPSPEKGLAETQASIPQAELTRDVWDLNNEQLWKVLEALQTKLLSKPNWPRGEGMHFYQGHPRKFKGPWGSGEVITDNRNWIPEGRVDGGMVNLCHGL